MSAQLFGEQSGLVAPRDVGERNRPLGGGGRVVEREPHPFARGVGNDERPPVVGPRDRIERIEQFVCFPEVGERDEAAHGREDQLDLAAGAEFEQLVRRDPG